MQPKRVSFSYQVYVLSVAAVQQQLQQRRADTVTVRKIRYRAVGVHERRMRNEYRYETLSRHIKYEEIEDNSGREKFYTRNA